MLISVPAGACRTACEAALKEFENKRNEDRDTIESKSYKSLYDGAVHNGLKPTLDDISKMREMVKRDVEHMMDSHPLNEHITLVRLYLRMLDYALDDAVALDVQSFELIGNTLGGNMRRTYAEIKELAEARCEDFINGDASVDVLLASLKALGYDTEDAKWMLWKAWQEKLRRRL